MIPVEIIEEIRSKVNIVDIISDYVNLTPRGDRFWGLSPFKTEKTASFTVTPSKQFYYCFSTQKGGDVFTFLMEAEGFTYPEAIEYLGNRVGVTIRHNEGGNSDHVNIRRVLEELYRKITETFHFFLIKSPIGKQALAYIKDRGFTEETIRQFSLGYAHPDAYWLHSFLKKKGYSDDFLAQTSLFSKKTPRWSPFAGRLIFPIRRHQGEIVGFGGRLLEGEGPKYINSSDSGIFHKRQNLYALDIARQHIRNKGFFILCEGYFDVLAFHQAGCQNAVAPLGTAFTPEQAKLLHRYTKKGVIVFDGDEAGLAAAKKSAIIFEENELDGTIVRLESGQDPADILVKKGSQTLENLLSLPISILNFILDEASTIFDIHTPSGKDDILDEIFPYIRAIESPVKQEMSLHVIAEKLSVSDHAVFTKFRNFRKPAVFRSSSSNTDKNLDTKNAPKNSSQYTRNPELMFFVSLIIHPEYFEILRPKLQKSEIKGAEARKLYALIEENYRKGDLSFNKNLEKVENSILRNIILKKASSNEYGKDPEGYIFSSFNRVHNDCLREKRREVELLMRQAEQRGDQDTLRELQSEKIYIDSELENS
ncbi:MAG: DNA primase [Salinispira sp.]